MSYPQIVDYNDAVQDPRRSFSDPALQAGTVAQTPMGLPLALSGGFALTYTVEFQRRKFAVRCFHTEVSSIEQRYAAISEKLRVLSSPHFADFEFQPRGILINGSRYPIVKMDWMAGKTLGVFLSENINDSRKLEKLREDFFQLSSYLERSGVAHGDIQNENVIVAPDGSLRLIDYDGMFVSGLTPGVGTEIGHKHFQHPQRAAEHFGPEMDRFSFLVIDVSLAALAADPRLHTRFREGGQAIIFKANDFADPDTSPAFQAVKQIPSLRVQAEKLADVCKGDIADVPRLEDFRAGRLRTRRISASSAPVVRSYISAFPVFDGTDYEGVGAQVGARVELVGKIVFVKQGFSQNQRGRKAPYIFLNFGDWQGECVKITIWSNGLRALSDRPDKSWVGRWISVTGMIDPHYHGESRGKSYVHVGISVTEDGQIVQLSEDEAQYRLGRRSRAAPQAPAIELPADRPEPAPAPRSSKRRAKGNEEARARLNQVAAKSDLTPTGNRNPTQRRPAAASSAPAPSKAAARKGAATTPRPSVARPAATSSGGQAGGAPGRSANQQLLESLKAKQAAGPPPRPWPAASPPPPIPNPSRPTPPRSSSRTALWIGLLLCAVAALLMAGS